MSFYPWSKCGAESLVISVQKLRPSIRATDSGSHIYEACPQAYKMHEESLKRPDSALGILQFRCELNTYIQLPGKLRSRGPLHQENR